MGIIKEIPMRTIPRPRKDFSIDQYLTIDEKIALQSTQSEQATHSQYLSKGVAPVHDTALDILKSGQKLLPSLPINSALENKQYLLNEQMLAEVLLKAAGISSNQTLDAYDNLNKELRMQDKEAIQKDEEFRRAINSISTAWNSLGVFRSDFNKNDNDKMGRNVFVAMVVKAFQDYFGALEWEVMDRNTGDRADYPYDFLHQPNPQDSFHDLVVPTIRDLTLYDAGAWVKTFNRKRELIELKSYLGTEFWIEMDRVPQIISVPANDNFTGIRATNYAGEKGSGKEVMMQGWWSRGFAWRYWQRSQTGVYIPYTPSEVCYFARYKRSDNIYGTDYMKFLKYQVQLLIDSTVAAGKTFQNGLVPSMIIEHPSVYSIDQIQQRIMEMRVDNVGPARFGSTMHLVNGETARMPTQTLHDMEWLEGQKYVAQLVWGFFGFTPDEFVGGDTNRATAYVKRNITKSRLLYPMMRYFEDKINREILPFIKGYKKSWKFAFIRELELDDKQKMAQTGAIRMGTISSALQQGLPLRAAIKIANDEALNNHDVDEIESAREDFMIQQQGMEGGMGGDGGMEDQDQGRYGNGSESYQPMKFGDYGQGGEGTEQRMGNKEEVEYQKAGYAVGDVFQKAGQKYEIISVNQNFAKAKVYVSDPSKVPEGRTVRHGNRGSLYYLTTLKQQTTSRKKKKGSPGGGGGDAEGDADEHSAPGAPDIEGATGQVKVSGNGVGIVAGMVDGKLKVQKLGNKETTEFVKKVMDCAGGDIEGKFIGCLKSQAKKEDLKISS